MKTPLHLALASAALSVCYASPHAQIYTSSRPLDVNSQPRTISPKLARLLLAQQLGVSRFHEIGELEETQVQILDDYQGSEVEIFARNDESYYEWLVYIIEGVENPEDLIDDHGSADLLVEDPPHHSHNARLVEDFNTQLQHIVAGRHDSSIQQLTQLQGLTRKHGEAYNSALATIKDILSQPSGKFQTVILMPPSRPTPSKSSPYGKYSMPCASQAHSKRQQGQEEPLEMSQSQDDTPPASSSSEVGGAPSSAPSLKPLPKGLLKICHRTPEAAVAETANCSSHGTVYLRSSGTIDCYACKCSSTKIKDASTGNLKTVHWGGPACQKKDVSGPFWLLAAVTIGLVSAVGWGIGLLVAVGSEELPSVIGAGVVGPTAGK